MRKHKVTLLCLLWAAGGCQSGASPQARNDTGQAEPKIERGFLSDVPKPAGFAINEKESEDRRTGRQRVFVRHVYEGKSDPYAVRDFYIEHMPQFGWTLRHAGNIQGTHNLLFRKKNESCNMVLTRAGTWNNKVRIEIIILQEG